MSRFDLLPNLLRQTFSRVRRTSGGTQDSYGDATFTEQITTGFKGFFQIGSTKGEAVTIGGKELSYDAVVYTSSTMIVGENDILLFGSSTSTTVSTRYTVQGVRILYDGSGPHHKECYVSQEVVA